MSFDRAVKLRRLANAPMSEAEWQVRCDLAADREDPGYKT